jgi:hypothetical protein
MHGMQSRKWIFTLALLALPALALAKTHTVGAQKIRGQPAIEEGKVLGYFIWVDPDGFHLRWCTDGKPYLFTGRIDTDKPVKELTEVREETGGWAKIYGNRIVMFSKTSRGPVDGIDLKIPGGRIVQIEFHIDGLEPTPEQIFLGKKGQHPGGVPLKIHMR